MFDIELVEQNIYAMSGRPSTDRTHGGLLRLYIEETQNIIGISWQMTVKPIQCIVENVMSINR